LEFLLLVEDLVEGVLVIQTLQVALEVLEEVEPGEELVEVELLVKEVVVEMEMVLTIQLKAVVVVAEKVVLVL
jgi:hypothetical protein